MWRFVQRVLKEFSRTKAINPNYEYIMYQEWALEKSKYRLQNIHTSYFLKRHECVLRRLLDDRRVPCSVPRFRVQFQSEICCFSLFYKVLGPGKGLRRYLIDGKRNMRRLNICSFHLYQCFAHKYRFFSYISALTTWDLEV